MKDAFEDFSTTPTLTFDPLPEEKEPEQPIPQEQEKKSYSLMIRLFFSLSYMICLLRDTIK